MNNVEIADVFDEIGDLLEFTDANPFRVRAYRNAARTIRDLAEPLAAIAKDPQRSLTDLPGIGKDLSEKIVTLLETGDVPQRSELRSQVPASVLELLRVPGLGPKKAATLWKELKITSLDELRAACEAHRIRALRGFGAKTEEAIAAGLPLAAAAHDRMYWAEADIHVQSLKEHLHGCPGVTQLEAAGSYRRGRETIGDVDLVVAADSPNEPMDRLAAYPGVAEVIARGETKTSVRLSSGLQVDLRVVPEESFGAALQYFTGSKQHNVELRGMAKGRGLKINEYGVFRGDKYVAGRMEADVYAALNLPCFPPEIREARFEFEWAAAGPLPRLVDTDDIVGDLHMHTVATDGKATLEEMVEAAKKRGLKYIAITDHSKRVTMANGLDAKRLRAQWKQIDKLNEKLSGITVLKGVEVDILERGGLDLADDVLAEADWVVASVHYGQKQPREQITERIVGALENPHVSAIAHPTGRIINRRAAYDVDLDTVFRVAAAHGKLMELNANPARLDLDDVGCMAAKSHGIPIVISTDAHSVVDLEKMRYGILQARRAGLTKADVANTRSWAQMKKLIGKDALKGVFRGRAPLSGRPDAAYVGGEVHARYGETVMPPEIVTLRDDQTGSSAKVLVGFGFNCYSFQACVAGEPIEVLWATPSFEAGTQRPSGSGIPVLFPFPGRLRGRQLHYHGQSYEIGDQADQHGNAIHGYVFNRPWTVVDLQPQRVVGEFHAGSQAPELLKKWPADFRLMMSYELRGNTLRSEITVSNPDDKPLPFGLGTHPYFRLPLGAGGVADECRIEVPAREYWVMDQMLPTGERRPAEGELDIAGGLPFVRTSLDHVFGSLQPEGDVVRTSIADRRTGRTLTQTFDRSFAACVVYNPPHRQEICIEPYSCIPDTYALTNRGLDAGLRILAPGASHQATIEIRLE